MSKPRFDAQAHFHESDAELRASGITKEELDALIMRAARHPDTAEGIKQADRMYREFKAKASKERALPRPSSTGRKGAA